MALKGDHALDNNTVRLHKAHPETVMTSPTEELANGGIRRQTGHRITALLLDGTPLTRECLTMSLNSCDRGLHVLPVASSEEVGALLRGPAPPQVVLYNLSGTTLAGTTLGEPQAILMIRQLVSLLDGVPLIVLTDHEEIDIVLEAFRLGVRGYIATSLGLSVALEAIRLVAAGGTFVPAASLSALMQGKATASRSLLATGPDGDDDAATGPNELTPRQTAVLNCLREGKANKIIAHELGMCESTVKVHVRNILKKLGATNRTQAVYLTQHKHLT